MEQIDTPGFDWSLTALGDPATLRVDTVGLGSELWANDGTAAGTVLLRDIAQGPGSSLPSFLGVAQGELWFIADDGVHGREIWATDGTAAGTRLLLDLTPPQPVSSDPAEITPIGDRAVFVASDPTHGRELWITDGTAAGTGLLADLLPGSDSSIPQQLRAVGDRVVFDALTTTRSRELWSTDGTPAGTIALPEIRIGLGSSDPRHLTAFDGMLYFSARDAERLLWRTDGTVAGTVPIGPSSLRIGDSPGDEPFHALGDRLLILTTTDIWTCDGINPAIPLGLTAPGTIGTLFAAVQDGRLYFMAASGGFESLWATDGTLGGTTQIAVTRGPCATLTPSARFATRDGLIYLAVTDDCGSAAAGTTGEELWVSDGTPAGTRQFLDAWPGPTGGAPSQFLATPGKLFFTAADPVSGIEFWSTDGTAAGTARITDAMPGHDNSIWDPRSTQVGVGTRVLLAATDPAHGRELWISDGTATGTRRLTDIAPGPQDGLTPGQLFTPRTLDKPAVLGDVLLLGANDGTTGNELFAIPMSLFDAATYELIGTGCPGFNGRAPDLVPTGVPARGQTLGIDLVDAAPSSASALLIGFGQTDTVLPGGCVVHPSIPVIDLPAATSATGEASLGFTVPPNGPSLVGVLLVMQWAVFDPNGAFENTLSFSRGVRVTIGGS